MKAEAKVASMCAACRRQGHLVIVQEVKAAQLTWTESYACECGHGFETGGTGLPAPGLRKALLEQAGRWEVWLDEAQGRPAAGKLLEAVVGATAAEVDSQLKVLPARVYQGSSAEAEFVAAALGKMGVEKGVRVVSAAAAAPAAR